MLLYGICKKDLYNYNIFNFCEFRDVIENDLDSIKNRFRNCDFQEDYVDKNYLNFKVLLYKGDIIGIASIEAIADYLGYNFYYVYSECTSDKEFLIDKDISRISNGRLLWCFILNYFYTINNNNSNFVVYNYPTESAFGYHVKMGMSKFSDLDYFTRFTLYKVFEDNYTKLNIENITAYESFNDATKIIDFETALSESYLFYFANSDINYGNLTDILESLPVSETVINSFKFNDNALAGGNKKRNKKTKKGLKKKSSKTKRAKKYKRKSRKRVKRKQI